jgi:DNA-directed RNA polymerase specialized sigma subunit
MKQPHFKRPKNSEAPEVTSKYYLSNSQLFPEVLKAKALGRVTEDLAKMLLMLARKYAQRPCFVSYTYKEDMISEAITNLCHNALKFNPEKSSNPFAYYTSCIHSSFLQFLNVEKKHRRIRDQLLVDIGENPSFNFTDENKTNSQAGEFKQEINELKDQIEEARHRVKQEAIFREEQLRLAEAEAIKLAAEAADPSLLEFDTEEDKPVVKKPFNRFKKR